MSINSDREADDQRIDLPEAWNQDHDALEAAFDHHRPELRRAVARRIDRSLRTRLDPSDVVQEAQLEALTRLPDYVARQPMPFRTGSTTRPFSGY